MFASICEVSAQDYEDDDDGDDYDADGSDFFESDDGGILGGSPLSTITADTSPQEPHANYEELSGGIFDDLDILGSRKRYNTRIPPRIPGGGSQGQRMRIPEPVQDETVSAGMDDGMDDGQDDGRDDSEANNHHNPLQGFQMDNDFNDPTGRSGDETENDFFSQASFLRPEIHMLNPFLKPDQQFVGETRKR